MNEREYGEYLAALCAEYDLSFTAERQRVRQRMRARAQRWRGVTSQPGATDAELTDADACNRKLAAARLGIMH